MSKIAFFSIPAHGHTNPTLGVVRELTARGHQVWYWSFEEFRAKIEAAGARFIGCDAYLPPAPKNLDRKIGKDFSALIAMVADTTLNLEEMVCQQLQEFAPDCLVSDSVCFWGKLFAGKLNIPYVCSTTTFAMNEKTAGQMKQSLRELVSMLLGLPRVNRKMKLLRAHGYPADSFIQLIQNDAKTSTIVYTSRGFQPMGESFPDCYAFVGPSVTGERSTARRERPLIYISMGTVMNQKLRFYRTCMDALQDMEADVVLSVGERTPLESLGEIPANFTVQNRVDQLAVLAEADVFLTHCGMNSANEALWFAVPTVLHPQQSEEDLVARRLEEFGAGLRLEQETPEAIRQAVCRVLAEDSFRVGAERMAQEFRQAGGAAAAVDFLERIIAGN